MPFLSTQHMKFYKPDKTSKNRILILESWDWFTGGEWNPLWTSLYSTFQTVHQQPTYARLVAVSWLLVLDSWSIFFFNIWIFHASSWEFVHLEGQFPTACKIKDKTRRVFQGLFSFTAYSWVINRHAFPFLCLGKAGKEKETVIYLSSLLQLMIEDLSDMKKLGLER